jgi:hypothetical protein
MTCGVVATSISGCGVCTACRVVCDTSRTLRGKAQHKLPEDGPIGPKHVGANIRDILTVGFNILCV